MDDKPYGVHVVVDPDHGERLRNLPAGEPAWVIDSATNHSVVAALVRERGETDHTADITTFRFNPQATPEHWFVAELSTIDLHHGYYSHDPPYSWLHVVGTAWSDTIQNALDGFGFSEHELTVDGFIARRNLNERRRSRS